MNKLLFGLAVITTVMFTACGGAKSDKSNESKTTNNETKKEKKGDNVELENYENKKIGFTILVPKNGKVLADTDFGFTNSQVLADGMNEVNVSVNPAVGEVKSVDDFKADLKNMMARNITKAEKTESGLMAINEQGILVTVYHRVGKAQAKVSAPKKMLDIATKIAMSLKSTK